MFKNIPYCDNMLFRIHEGDGNLYLYGDFDKSMKLPNENELKYSELFRRTAEVMGQFSGQFLVGEPWGLGDADGQPRRFFYYRDRVCLLDVEFGPELVDEMFDCCVWAMQLMSVVVKRLETNSLDDVLAGLEPFFRLPEGHREFSFCDY